MLLKIWWPQTQAQHKKYFQLWLNRNIFHLTVMTPSMQRESELIVRMKCLQANVFTSSLVVSHAGHGCVEEWEADHISDCVECFSPNVRRVWMIWELQCHVSLNSETRISFLLQLCSVVGCNNTKSLWVWETLWSVEWEESIKCLSMTGSFKYFTQLCSTLVCVTLVMSCCSYTVSNQFHEEVCGRHSFTLLSTTTQT